MLHDSQKYEEIASRLGYLKVIIEETGERLEFGRMHADILESYLDLLRELFLFSNNPSFARRHQQALDSIGSSFSDPYLTGEKRERLCSFLEREKEYLKRIKRGIFENESRPESIEVFLSGVGPEGNLAGQPRLG